MSLQSNACAKAWPVGAANTRSDGGAADDDATEWPVQDRQIGMVFQGYALFRHMTVADNIMFGPRIQDLDMDEDER